jgi:hypothetical protein
VLTKMAFFGLGYLLGSRAGRERYEEMVRAARDFLQGEEVSTAVGFVRGMLWILRQRGRGLERTQP